MRVIAVIGDFGVCDDFGGLSDSSSPSDMGCELSKEWSK